MSYNQIIHEVEDCFKSELLDILGDSDKVSIGEIEVKIQESMAKVARFILQAKVGKVEEEAKQPFIVTEDGQTLPRHGSRKRKYLSIFGMVDIKRSFYWKKGHSGVFPLDAQFQLPARQYSYPLQEIVSFLNASSPLADTAEILRKTLGIELTDRVIMDIVSDIGDVANDFRDNQPPPDKDNEMKVLVATIDGKGVPMRKDELEGVKGKDGKEPGKKMSGVGVVYSTNVDVRTVKQVMSQYDRKCREKDDPDISGKRIHGEFCPKENFSEKLRNDAVKRGLENYEKLVFVADGETCIWNLKEKYFPEFTGVLDIFHVMGYLWKCARSLRFKEHYERKHFVRRKTKLLLAGKFDKCIFELKKEMSDALASLEARSEIRKTIGYFGNHRNYMRYDDYLAEGLPIGSGVVESACKNLVRQRMEGSGMRWSKKGANAMLKIRSIKLNGDFSELMSVYQQEEQTRLYPAIWQKKAA